MGALQYTGSRLTNKLFLAGALFGGLLIGGCGDDDDNGPLATEDQTISEIVQSRSDLSTLELALDSAGLVSTLNGTGPFTLFAPNNAAFNAVSSATLDTLLANPQAQLKPLLQYHVVSGNIRAAQLDTTSSLTSVQGSTISVAVVNDTIVLNGSAQVIQANITAQNGVIHIINEVLSPF